MKSLLILIFLALFNFTSTAQLQTPPDTGLVKWITFKQAFELNKKQPKPFLIDIYTDWCGWCKHMIKTTYSSPDLASYINSYYYPVKFNAETKDTVEFLGVKYANPGPAKSTHQLVVKFLGQNISYPSTVFMNNNFQFSLLSAGYLDVKKIEPILVYTVENVFRTTSFDDFKKYYEKAFTEQNEAPKKPTWLSMNQALVKQKEKPKKMLVNIYTNWCNGCRVMNKTTFTDSSVAAYLDKNFYMVDFNAELKDTIIFQNQKFINDPASGMPFHQLALALLRNNITLPSMVIFDEEQKIIDVIPFYLSPESLKPIATFYGDNAYKTMKWEDYKKTLNTGK